MIGIGVGVDICIELGIGIGIGIRIGIGIGTANTWEIMICYHTHHDAVENDEKQKGKYHIIVGEDMTQSPPFKVGLGLGLRWRRHATFFTWYVTTSLFLALSVAFV